MPIATWQLTDSTARLALADWSANVDLRRPDRGLVSGPPGAQLLGVRLSHDEEPIEPSDAYTRVGDLVATYPPTAARPMRVQVYWRAVGSASVDLQVSVQTQLLEARAEIVVQSVVDGNAPVRLAEAEHCWLYRLPGDAHTYVEMVHRADTCTSSIERLASTAGFRLAHRLFDASLEKGVILRARLRGLMLARKNDQEVALDAYRRFVDAPLPLTT